MVLAESQLHGDRQNYTAAIRETPRHQPELLELSLDVKPGGSRSDRLAGVRPQERVTRHTVEQIIDSARGLPMLDVLVPPILEQLVDVLQFFDTFSLVVTEQVIRDLFRGQNHSWPCLSQWLPRHLLWVLCKATLAALHVWPVVGANGRVLTASRCPTR